MKSGPPQPLFCSCTNFAAKLLYTQESHCDAIESSDWDTTIEGNISSNELLACAHLKLRQLDRCGRFALWNRPTDSKNKWKTAIVTDGVMSQWLFYMKNAIACQNQWGSLTWCLKVVEIGQFQLFLGVFGHPIDEMVGIAHCDSPCDVTVTGSENAKKWEITDGKQFSAAVVLDSPQTDIYGHFDAPNDIVYIYIQCLIIVCKYIQ